MYTLGPRNFQTLHVDSPLGGLWMRHGETLCTISSSTHQKKKRFPAYTLHPNKAETQPQFCLTAHCMNDGNAPYPKLNPPVTGPH